MAARVNLTDALISATAEGAVIRTGYIRRVNPQNALVEVGGSTFEAAYLNSYNPPILGDLVAVAKQDATWLVLGSMAGTPPEFNLLNNGSFEFGLSGWSAVQITGAALPAGATVTTASDPNSPDTGQVAQFVNASTTNNLHMALVSSAMPARPGESFMVNGYVSSLAFAPTGTTVIPPHNVQAFMSWHVDATTAYPDPSASIPKKSTMVQQFVDLRESPPYTFLSGAVTVPNAPAITAMRLVLAGIMANNPAVNGGVLMDAFTVRRL